MGKQIRNSFTSKNIVSAFKPLQLCHMNLCGPLALVGKKKDILLLLSMISLVLHALCFLFKMMIHLKNFEFFYEKVQRDGGYYITSIEKDHGAKFESSKNSTMCKNTIS